MISIGTGDSEGDDDMRGLDEKLALKMLQLLQEHGWDFTYGRDPILILIECEEHDTDDNGESET